MRLHTSNPVVSFLLVNCVHSWVPSSQLSPIYVGRRGSFRRWLTPEHEDNSSTSPESLTENDAPVLEKDSSMQASPKNNNQQFNLDEFLDTPFFDPEAALQDETSSPLLKRFAAFVTNDYQKAEATIAGVFFVFLIVATQEALRYQINGDAYVPFTKSSPPGSLF